MPLYQIRKKNREKTLFPIKKVKEEAKKEKLFDLIKIAEKASYLSWALFRDQNTGFEASIELFDFDLDQALKKIKEYIELTGMELVSISGMFRIKVRGKTRPIPMEIHSFGVVRIKEELLDTAEKKQISSFLSLSE